MRILVLFISCFIFTSCIPLSIAPNLEDGKVIRGKKFKRKLPNRYSYVFTDPKNADEFYYYINTKYQRDNTNVEDNTPLLIDGEEYFISFYEAEKSTKTINFIPLAIDAARSNNGNDPLLEDIYTSRTGTWYIVLMVSDIDYKDALHPNYTGRQKILAHIEELKNEYLRTRNYNQAILPKSTD